MNSLKIIRELLARLQLAETAIITAMLVLEEILRSQPRDDKQPPVPPPSEN